MSKQPEALELADLLNKKDFALHRQSANELRRLYKVNAELVEALKDLLDNNFDKEAAEENARAAAEIGKTL